MRLSFYLDHFLAAVLINMCVSSIKMLRVSTLPSFYRFVGKWESSVGNFLDKF